MNERTVSGAGLTPGNAVAQAAERLTLAARTGVPTAPVRDVLGSTDVALAYRVQNALTAARKAAGARLVGRKVALPSPGCSISSVSISPTSVCCLTTCWCPAA